MAGSSARILAGGNMLGAWTVTNTAGSMAVGTTYVYSLSGNIIKTDVTRDESGRYDITVEGVEDNSAFKTFIETYTSVSAGGGIEELLYVGITGDNTKRQSQHRRNAFWFGKIASATFEHFESREDALAAEAAAIESE